MKIEIDLVGCSIPDSLHMKIDCGNCDESKMCKAIQLLTMIREVRDLLETDPETLKQMAKQAAYHVMTMEGGE